MASFFGAGRVRDPTRNKAQSFGVLTCLPEVPLVAHRYATCSLAWPSFQSKGSSGSSWEPSEIKVSVSMKGPEPPGSRVLKNSSGRLSMNILLWGMESCVAASTATVRSGWQVKMVEHLADSIWSVNSATVLVECSGRTIPFRRWMAQQTTK